MNHQDHAEKSSYAKLGWMIGVHFVLMFFLMYSMVNALGEVYLNSNNLYMTALMVAPMGITMILMMPSMYRSKKFNLVWSGASVWGIVLFYSFMRTQAFVGDKQFLRAMIPHHSGAILMCSKAQISDPEIKRLCEQIVEGQRKEIDQMKQILGRL